MGLFSKLTGKAAESSKRLSGRTDLLEGVCAAAAIMAAADGEVSDAEVAATTKAIKSNSVLSAAFDQRAIEACADTMLQRAAGGRVGRAALMKEIEEASKGSVEDAETILLTALDIADSDGTFSDAEKQTADKLAKAMGLTLDKYL